VGRVVGWKVCAEMSLPEKWTTVVQWAFAELSPETQELLTELCDQMYDTDDSTPLQELTARAYLLGKED
jgi:hypothetical protein